jgi:secondary thiamine-phosphate synthase enzyme
MLHQERLTISTPGRGTIEISDQVETVIRTSGVQTGLCHVFGHHTSASLMLCENADPTVRDDLERFMSRIAPDGDPQFRHRSEGPDDMPAHIRSVLTQAGLSIPVANGSGALGTWQGIYLWEHRRGPHRRHLTVTVVGEA